ncbi:Uncharacterized protein Adt_20259 [Abeliophyllum distichum]|uniref:Glabrous enhancer-binding protein-like DBD domain-containing protein n=1 Tax=Abeliophyllum distichum TaxID=126358 RepID=A0ABD1SW30_9LAMI
MAFYDQIKDKLQLDFNKNQLVEKLRVLKKKYRNIIIKSVNGTTVRAALTNEARFDDNDHNNPNFVGNQSPNLNNPNGFDGNSKTPRSRKRNRVGAVKVEEK